MDTSPSPSVTIPAVGAAPAVANVSAEGGQSPSQLATLLAQTLAELETTRAERDAARASSLPSSSINAKLPGPSTSSRTGTPDDVTTATIAALQSTNDEQQRIIADLNTRLKAISEAWFAYDKWTSAGEARALDARRTVSALITNTQTAEGTPPLQQVLSPRALPPQTQSFQLPSPLGSGPSGGSRRQSRHNAFVHPGPPNFFTAQMQLIAPGAPGGPPVSQAGVPMNLPPIPSGVVGKRPREPSPLPPPLRRHSNEDETIGNEPYSASSENEKHRMKRLRPDPNPTSNRREKARFSDSPRSATGQFMSPQYTFSSAQQQQQQQQQSSQPGGPEYPPTPSSQSQQQYPRAGKPRTPQYEGNPPPPPPPRFSNSSEAISSSHPPQHPPPLHIGPSGDHPQSVYPDRRYPPHHSIRRESDGTLVSVVTPTSAATTTSARSNGRGSKDSYPSPLPYSAGGSRVEFLRHGGEEIFESVSPGHRTDSPPPMMVLDTAGRRTSSVTYEGGRRPSQPGQQRDEDEDAMKKKEEDRKRQTKQRGLLRVDVAPPSSSKREGSIVRRRSSEEDQDMRDADREDNDDKDSVEEFLINTAIDVEDDDLNEQDELRDDDRDPEDPHHVHHSHHANAHRAYHRGVSPTSPADPSLHRPGTSPTREMTDRERERWRQRDQELEQAQQQQQRRPSRSQYPNQHQQHQYHADQLAPIQHPAHPDMNNQFYASNGLVKTKPERSGDVFRHYSTPSGGQQPHPGREGGGVYSPQQTYPYPRSPEGIPVPYGGRRATAAGLPSPLPGSGEGVGGGGVEYVQQPSGGGRGGTSLPHLLPTPTSAMSNKSSFDFPPNSAHPHSATIPRHPQGHMRRHSSSMSPTTATSLPSVTSLMFPGNSPVSATQQQPPTRHAGPGPAVKPTFNEKGERICRACGQPGRYRDGKCVEKWGPGPAGPGTVCDRCRKKMKRVERRGTTEAGMAQRIPEKYYVNSSAQSHPIPNMQRHPGEDSPPGRDQQQQPPPTPASHQQQQRMFHFQPPLTTATSSTTWNSSHAIKPEAGGGVVRHGRSGSFSSPVSQPPPKHKPSKEKERRRAPSFSPSPPPPPISNETRRRSIGGAGEQGGTMMERAAADLMADAEDEDSPAGTTVKEKDLGDGEGDEDGDGEEEQEEEDAMGEEENDDDGATKNGGIVVTRSSKSPAGPPQPPPASTRPSSKDEHHPPLLAVRSPRPSWVKLEDEYSGRDDRSSVATEAKGAVKASS
ncbi:hypothetical protein FRB96_009003 [Tulasnella sp. 330]|nr:hypothetical protein FRB96_009003 [Tulasnella sp. 330]KAG8889077.1 hypothetical protein FRB98_005826 [Tulasnella sp. 332]